jgi:hypothetical protein
MAVTWNWFCGQLAGGNKQTAGAGHLKFYMVVD